MTGKTGRASLYQLLMMVFLRFLALIVLAHFAGLSTALAEVFPRHSNDSIQDKAQILNDGTAGILLDLAEQDGRFIRVVIIGDRFKYGSTGSFNSYADDLAASWHIAKRPDAILVIHETGTDQVVIRLGAGYTQQDMETANSIVQQRYLPAIRDGRYQTAHVAGMTDLLFTLHKKPPAPVQITTPPPTYDSATDYTLTDDGQMIQDHAGILSYATIGRLNIMLRAHPTAPIRIVTVPDSVVQSGGNNFTVYAHALFQNWGLLENPANILIVHNADTQKIRLVFGRNYSLAQTHRIRAVVKTAALPALNSGDAAQAHILGLRVLLAALENESASPSSSIVFQDTGQSLHDLIGILAQDETRELQQMFDTLQVYGQTVRLVIIDDYRKFEPEKSLLTFTADLFRALELEENPTAIMVLHDVSHNRFLLRINKGYDQNTRARARHVFYSSYRRAPNGTSHMSHVQVMQTLLAELPAPYAPKPWLKARPKSGAKDQENDQPQASPIVLGLLALIVAIIAGGTFHNHRKTSQPRRERAARIAIFKRHRQNKP